MTPAALAGASCCGTGAAHGEPAGSTTARGGYYQTEDLARFGEITRVNPALGEAFFNYYQQVMEEGVLTRREKALIALSLAHALKCPYCINAYTGTLLGLGANEARRFMWRGHYRRGSLSSTASR